jgi:plasmid stability protein
MSQIMIRNLDPAVIEALHRGADTCGTSMEEQASRAPIKASEGVARQPRSGSPKCAASLATSKDLRSLTICGATDAETRNDGRRRCQRRTQMVHGRVGLR